MLLLTCAMFSHGTAKVQRGLNRGSNPEPNAESQWVRPSGRFVNADQQIEDLLGFRGRRFYVKPVEGPTRPSPL